MNHCQTMQNLIYFHDASNFPHYQWHIDPCLLCFDSIVIWSKQHPNLYLPVGFCFPLCNWGIINVFLSWQTVFLKYHKKFYMNYQNASLCLLLACNRPLRKSEWCICGLLVAVFAHMTTAHRARLDWEKLQFSMCLKPECTQTSKQAPEAACILDIKGSKRWFNHADQKQTKILWSYTCSSQIIKHDLLHST